MDVTTSSSVPSRAISLRLFSFRPQWRNLLLFEKNNERCLGFARHGKVGLEIQRQLVRVLDTFLHFYEESDRLSAINRTMVIAHR
jgi:hypothetical protein